MSFLFEFDKMVMRTIPSLDIDAFRAFVKLFDASKVYSINLHLFNGTVTRSQEFPDLDVTVIRTNLELSGRTLANVEKALARVDHNQIQKVNVTLIDFIRCTLDMLSRELTVRGLDTLPLATIQKFVKDFDIYKVTICE